MDSMADDGPSSLELTRSWIAAVNAVSIADALRGVYSAIASEIAQRGPACWASGRCCNFEHAGHRLYVTGLEAAYTLAHLPASRPDDPCLSLPQLSESRRRGGCPFQVSNLCGIHGIKPLGCRVYFCDRSAQIWQHELTESGLKEIREIHDRFDVPYRYGEWRSVLGMFLEPGDAD